MKQAQRPPNILSTSSLQLAVHSDALIILYNVIVNVIIIIIINIIIT